MRSAHTGTYTRCNANSTICSTRSPTRSSKGVFLDPSPSSINTPCLRHSAQAQRLLSNPFQLPPFGFSTTGILTSSKRSGTLIKAAATPATAAAVGTLAATTQLFTYSTVVAASLAVLLLFAPISRSIQRLIKSPWFMVPLSLVYGILLCWSWQPDTFSLILPGSIADGLKGGFSPQFFPNLSGIVTLFARVPTAASLWVHLLAIAIFAARAIVLDGLDSMVPTWHSVLLCMTLAPLGLLSHAFTKTAAAVVRSKSGNTSVNSLR